MEVDLEVFLAAIIDHEGGTYVIPFDAFNKAANVEGKSIAIDITNDGTSLTLTLIDNSEIPEGLDA